MISSALSPHRSVTLLALIAVAIPAAALYFLVIQNVELLMHEDYWQILAKILTPQGFTPHLSRWVVNTNEHPVVIPNLFFVLNILFFKGSNHGLAVLSWLIALCETLILIRMLPPAVRTSKGFPLVAFAISAFLFCPASAGNWVSGFAGVHLGLGNLLAFLTLYFFCRAYFAFSWPAFNLSVLCGWLGTFTNTPGLFVWVLLSTIVLCSRKVPARFLIFPISLICSWPYNLYLILGPYALPAATGESSILERGIFFLATLGSPFSGNLPAATAFGILGLLAAALVLVRLFVDVSKSEIDAPTLTWLLIAAYGLSICLSAAIARDKLGIETAVAPRYRFFTVPFWIAILVLLRHIADLSTTFRRALPCLWLGFALVLIFRSWSIGIPLINTYLERENSTRFTAISMQLDIPDRGWIRNSLTQTPQDVIDLIPSLKKIGHIPFDPNGEICPPWGQEFSVPRQSNIAGSFDNHDKYLPNAYRVQGSLDRQGKAIDKILLLNQSNAVRGCAVTGYPRQFLEIRKKLGVTGWHGYAKTAGQDTALYAYAVLTTDNQLALIGKQDIQSE